jgi:hypothetical protein
MQKTDRRSDPGHPSGVMTVTLILGDRAIMTASRTIIASRTGQKCQTIAL